MFWTCGKLKVILLQSLLKLKKSKETHPSLASSRPQRLDHRRVQVLQEERLIQNILPPSFDWCRERTSVCVQACAYHVVVGAVVADVGVGQE